MKYKILTICLFLNMNILLNADYLKKGVIMCNNPDSVKKLVQLDNNGDSTGFLNYFSQMTNMGVCNQTVMAMTPSDLGRIDLYGGVTQIGSRIFVITSDIK